MRTYQRGFFCADLQLRYPYRECTITVPMLLVWMLLLPMLFISVVEIMRVCKNFHLRKYLWNLWRSLTTFSFGFIATYLTTELAKNIVSRLRPHFYTACQPRLLDGSSCADAQNQGIYVEHYFCTNRNLSVQQLRELQVSFPSAHSSLSFYSMLFLAFYLHAVWKGAHSGVCRVLRHIIQFLMLLLAWYIALSRVADHWHHWSDVLAGMVMGVAYAIITSVYIGEMVTAVQHCKRKYKHHHDHHDHEGHCCQHKSLQQQKKNVTLLATAVAATATAPLPPASQKESLMQQSDCEWKLQAVLPT